MATHSAALARFEIVSARREKVVAQQDALVASRKAEVDAAVAKAARIMGIEVAAAVLNLSKSEVRRASKATKAGRVGLGLAAVQIRSRDGRALTLSCGQGSCSSRGRTSEHQRLL